MMNLRDTLTLEPGATVKIGPAWNPTRRVYVDDEWSNQRATIELIDTDDACVTLDDADGSVLWVSVSRLQLMD